MSQFLNLIINLKNKINNNSDLIILTGLIFLNYYAIVKCSEYSDSINDNDSNNYINNSNNNSKNKNIK